MPDPDDARPGDSRQQTTTVGHFFHQAERLVYVLVAALLLVAGVLTCGDAVWSAYKEMRNGDSFAPALFTLLSELLLVLIIMELLRTVGRFIRKEEPGVGVTDLTPFLVVGAISATRRLLIIGANLSIAESEKAAEGGGAGQAAGPAVESEHFRQAMIELGINGGLILAITVSLLLIGRYLQGSREVSKGDEAPAD